MGRVVRTFVFFALVSLFAFVPGASAQTGSFVISQHGTPVGTAAFQFTSGPHGYDSTSQVRVAMQGLNYALSKTEPPSTVRRST